MKKIALLLIALCSLSTFADDGIKNPCSGNDAREAAILASPMVQAIQTGLKKEQGLRCVPSCDENNDLGVNHLVEDGRSKFELFLMCDYRNGQAAVIKGVLGDGGQTAVESFKLRTGVDL